MLYSLLLTLDGELSTFLRFTTRRPAAVSPYNHDQLGASLRPLVESLRVLLNTVLERGAQPIALKEQGTRRYLAVFSEGEADIYTGLVLGVRADMPREVLRRDFPAKTKIAPQEQLNRILGAHLPGLTLSPLPLAPRQIPFNSGVLYFEVQREGPLWEGVRQYGGLGLQVMSDFPELSLEMWGIRDR
jgi:type VI secretion system protein ImpJ